MKAFRVIRVYGFYKLGDIIYPTGIMRDNLVTGGWAEPVEQPEPRAVETALREPAVETAVVKRKRGRPRKVRI